MSSPPSPSSSSSAATILLAGQLSRSPSPWAGRPPALPRGPAGRTWSGFGPEDWTRAIAEQDAINREFFDTGELLGAYGLADAENARVVRVREGAAAVTDGPYLEAKEHPASFWLPDVETAQRALDIAARMPFASFRGAEVWPVMSRWPRSPPAWPTCRSGPGRARSSASASGTA